MGSETCRQGGVYSADGGFEDPVLFKAAADLTGGLKPHQEMGHFQPGMDQSTEAVLGSRGRNDGYHTPCSLHPSF